MDIELDGSLQRNRVDDFVYEYKILNSLKVEIKRNTKVDKYITSSL